MAFLFKKKKPKGGLETPPPPPPGSKASQQQSTDDQLDIPDVFHEVKPGAAEVQDDSVQAPQEQEEANEGQSQELDDDFSKSFDIPKPEIPEMPDLPDIPVSETKETQERVVEGPIYVKSRDFQEMLGQINKIKEEVKVTQEIYNRMNEIKNQKDKIFSDWKNSLENVQRKLTYVEKSLYEV